MWSVSQACHSVIGIEKRFADTWLATCVSDIQLIPLLTRGLADENNVERASKQRDESWPVSQKFPWRTWWPVAYKRRLCIKNWDSAVVPPGPKFVNLRKEGYGPAITRMIQARDKRLGLDRKLQRGKKPMLDEDMPDPVCVVSWDKREFSQPYSCDTTSFLTDTDFQAI
jgi:hypothetical protein